MNRLGFLLAVLCPPLLAQSATPSAFVLDQSKPWAYLQFDHVGPRKPIRPGEGNNGLWLKLVNNSKVPIVVQCFDASPGEPGVGLMDEVVPDEALLQVSSAPETGKGSRARGKGVSQHRPTGYSSETGGILKLEPGRDVLFSVPLGHVSDEWHLVVKFALDVSRSALADGPFTYLPFYKYQITTGDGQ